MADGRTECTEHTAYPSLSGSTNCTHCDSGLPIDPERLQAVRHSDGVRLDLVRISWVRPIAAGNFLHPLVEQLFDELSLSDDDERDIAAQRWLVRLDFESPFNSQVHGLLIAAGRRGQATQRLHDWRFLREDDPAALAHAAADPPRRLSQLRRTTPAPA